MCRPDYFNVTYEINPWMSIKRKPGSEKAQAQWSSLVLAFGKVGADLEFVEPSPDNPDLVFTANSGLVKNNLVYLANFHHTERQDEAPWYRRWFEENNFDVYAEERYSFEGEGDALFVDKLLFGGYGFRTSPKVYDTIADKFNLNDIILCELVDPRFYHLDTCFGPISETQALVYTSGFTKESLRRIEQNIEVIPVSEADGLKFVCNNVVIDKQVIIPADCTQTFEKLAALGYEIFPVELGEFMKAGGAAKCLCVRLDRP